MQGYLNRTEDKTDGVVRNCQNRRAGWIQQINGNIMEAQTSPSPPFIMAGLGPCELSCSQLHSTILYYQQWVFWSAFCNDKVHCGKPRVAAAATADGAVIKNQIIRLLQLLMLTTYWKCLVQLWGLVKIGDKTYLTTCDQPFALRYFNDQDVQKLCEYRKHCLDYLIIVDDDEDEIGTPGRVFCSGFPEYAGDVGDYTSREYPQHDFGVGRVKGYWALPIYHPTQHLPSGVLEIASPLGLHFFRYQVLEKLQRVNLTTTCVRLGEISSCQNGEIAKIEEVLGEVIEICELGYGDTKIWTTTGEILSSYRGENFIQKGQGVVGRAFSSKNACFWRDVRQLSITEYPLVPTAQSYKCFACFAVCLQSSCSSNCIYILEFFLPGNKKDHGVPRTLLRMLMVTLKEHLQSSFKSLQDKNWGRN